MCPYQYKYEKLFRQNIFTECSVQWYDCIVWTTVYGSSQLSWLFWNVRPWLWLQLLPKSCVYLLHPSNIDQCGKKNSRRPFMQRIFWSKSCGLWYGYHLCASYGKITASWSSCGILSLFRWFKFTLKPPYTIMHGNLLLAIWDTSHWTSFVKFGLKTAWWQSPMTSYDQFWNMSNFDDSRAVRVICQKKMPSENRFFLDEGVTRLRRGIGILGGQVPRLYGGTIFGGVWHTWGVWRGI